MQPYNRIHLKLLSAIRSHSDPAEWADLELQLFLPPDTGERDGWNDSDWERYDFGISLRLSIAMERSNTFALHKWAILKRGFRQRLEAGELVAKGYVQPVGIQDQPHTVPSDYWQFLELDFDTGVATGGGRDFIVVSVDRAQPSAGGLGRKTDVESKREEILARFLQMNVDKTVSFEQGGLTRAAESLRLEFPSYQVDSIRKIIHPEYRQQKELAHKASEN